MIKASKYVLNNVFCTTIDSCSLCQTYLVACGLVWIDVGNYYAQHLPRGLFFCLLCREKTFLNSYVRNKIITTPSPFVLCGLFYISICISCWN